MHIVCCVKQVPDTTQVKIEPETNTLVRTGVESICNPYDLVAVEAAIGLAEKYGGRVTVISMGPPQAEAALRECLSLGADEAILLSDRAFAGADTLATSFTLYLAIKRLSEANPVDLVICGKQAIDGDTAQVGPEIAEILGLPQVTYGIEVKPGGNPRQIRVKREVEAGYEVIEASMPALVTVSKGETVRRAPSFPEVITARRKPIRTVAAADLGIPEEELGLKGSFTQVVKIFPPPEKKSCRILQNAESDQAAQEIYTFLKERRFIE